MTKAVRITVDGASLLAQEGQSLTAALMMAGVSAIRKSPTGEARGALCAMGSCHECRATVDGVRGVRTCLVPVKEGLRVEREMKLPRLPLESSPGGEGGDAPQIIETGLAVIGAGPAGLAAACIAAELGMKVVIIDESMGPGGRIWSHRHDPPLAARSWLERAREAGVLKLQGYSVFSGQAGVLDVARVTDGKRVRIQCQSMVVATGARERFLPFPGWTLPGVVGAGALQSLIKGGLNIAGRRVLVAGTGPLLLAVARLAKESGAEVILAEQSSLVDHSRLAIPLLLSPSRWKPARQLLKALGGIERYSSSWVTEARGGPALKEVVLRTPAGDRVLEVDGLAIGYGLIPETRIAAGLGCEVETTGTVRVDSLQRTSVPGTFCAGEPTGIAGCEAAIDEGMVAGIAAAGKTPKASLLARVRRHRFWGQALEDAHPLREELGKLARDSEILCRCEDVTVGEVSEISSIREARLIHRVGMGPCQGRVCESAAHCQSLSGSDTIRPPWTVVPGENQDMSSAL